MSTKNLLTVAAQATRPLPVPTTTGSPGHEARCLRRADDLAASGRLDEALAQLRNLLHEVPGSTRGYLRMASLLRETRRPAEARAVLQAAVTHSPECMASREALAGLCLEVGDYAEAIAHGLALLARRPQSLTARELLTAAYLRLGEFDRALGVTEEMLRLAPLDPMHHFKRAVLLQQLGRQAEAARSFVRLLALTPEEEIAQEARQALRALERQQIGQILLLASEDIPFRVRLAHNAGMALESRGFFLSEAGVGALQQHPFHHLPEGPVYGRHYCYH